MLLRKGYIKEESNFIFYIYLKSYLENSILTLVVLGLTLMFFMLQASRIHYGCVDLRNSLPLFGSIILAEVTRRAGRET